MKIQKNEYILPLTVGGGGGGIVGSGSDGTLNNFVRIRKASD